MLRSTAGLAPSPTRAASPQTDALILPPLLPPQPLLGLSPAAVKRIHAPSGSPGFRAPRPPRGLLWCPRLPPAGRPSSGLRSRLTHALRGLRLGPGQLHTRRSQGISARERLVLWVLSRPCVPPCPRQGPTEVKEDFKMSPEKINLPPPRLPYPLRPSQNRLSFPPPISPGTAAWNSKRVG